VQAKLKREAEERDLELAHKRYTRNIAKIITTFQTASTLSTIIDAICYC
jgi:hypothetical protein